MRIRGPRAPITPQQKLIHVNKKLGNKGIAKQQGTSRVIYDSLPLNGDTTFRFFEAAQNRNFPFTNMASEGNKMGVGEAMVVERIYFSVVEVDPGTEEVLNVYDLGAYGAEGLLIGDLNIETANSTVLKQLSMLSSDPRFNKDSASDVNNNFSFDTDLTLDSLLDFVFRLRTGVYAVDANHYLRCTVEGVGAIINNRTTY